MLQSRTFLRLQTSRRSLFRSFRRLFSTHYETLGVNAKATKSEIRKAYLAKAKELHPDLQPEGKKEEATLKFQELLTAYNILSDESERQKYDADLSGEGRASYEEEYRRRKREERKPKGDPRYRRWTQEELEEEMNRLKEEFAKEQAEFHAKHGGAPEGTFRQRGKDYFKQNMKPEEAKSFGLETFKGALVIMVLWVIFSSGSGVKERRRERRRQQRYNDEIVQVYHRNRQLSPSVQAQKFRDPSNYDRDAQKYAEHGIPHGSIPVKPRFGDPSNYNRNRNHGLNEA